MKQDDVIKKLLEIVKMYIPQDVNADDIALESHLMQELGINSAHLVDIALDVEDAFNITLDEKDMESMQTVGAALHIVTKKLSH